MSALGQKRTFAAQSGMSALTPKADMCSALAHVCFGPKADIGRASHLNSVPYLLAISFNSFFVRCAAGAPGRAAISRKKRSNPEGATVQSKKEFTVGILKAMPRILGNKYCPTFFDRVALFD